MGFSNQFNLLPSNLQTCQSFLVYPLSFHTLPNSFALPKNSTRLFSGDSALFAENTRGLGHPPLLKSASYAILRKSKNNSQPATPSTKHPTKDAPPADNQPTSH